MIYPCSYTHTQRAHIFVVLKFRFIYNNNNNNNNNNIIFSILIGCVADFKSQQPCMLHKSVIAHFVAHEKLPRYACSKEY